MAKAMKRRHDIDFRCRMVTPFKNVVEKKAQGNAALDGTGSDNIIGWGDV